MKSLRGKLITTLIILTGVCLGYLLWGRLQLGLTRYFDADEMSYLHWAHNVATGKLPYADFFLYVPAGFVYFLAPLYRVVSGATILVTGRMVAFLVFVGIATVISSIFWLLRRSWLAILAAVFLVFLPLPADKFIEIRPDNLAMLLALVALALQIMALQQPLQHQGLVLKWKWGWAGFLYGLSLLVLPKTLPQVIVATMVTIAFGLWGEGKWRDKLRRVVLWFVVGLLTPLVLFGFYLIVSSGTWQRLDMAIYVLTTVPFEVNRIAEIFPILQWQFFYPNATFYGAPGWNIGLLANHAIWIVGLLFGTIRFLTPYIPNGKKGMWAEILVAGSLLAHVVAFMHGYPVRHAQYLIPIAIFVALYAADAVGELFLLTPKTAIGRLTGAVLFLGLLAGLSQIYGVVNAPKLMSTNARDIALLQRVLATIPKDAYVLDLTGSTIYYRDPYYFSALPFGQYIPYFSRRFPALIPALEATETRYIFDGNLGRIKTLSPQDRAYIGKNFTPDTSILGLWKKNGIK